MTTSCTANPASGGACNGSYVYQHPIKKYQCPDDPSPSGSSGMGGTASGGANIWATGNYAANYLIFGDPVHGTTEGAARIRHRAVDATDLVAQSTHRPRRMSGLPAHTTASARRTTDSARR